MIQPTPSASAWDHFSLLLGAAILAAAAFMDPAVHLSPQDWLAVVTAAAACGVKGVGGVLPRA